MNENFNLCDYAYKILFPILNTIFVIHRVAILLLVRPTTRSFGFLVRSPTVNSRVCIEAGIKEPSANLMSYLYLKYINNLDENNTSGKHDRVMYTPLEPFLYSKTEVCRGIPIFFLFLLQIIDCGYSLEPPWRGGSNVYPQSMFGAKKKEKYFKKNLLNFFQFLQLKKNMYLKWACYINEHCFWR